MLLDVSRRIAICTRVGLVSSDGAPGDFFTGEVS